MKNRRNCFIIGIPDHVGVANVGGRVGAKGGPAAFRNAFKRFACEWNLKETVSDLGDAGPFHLNIESNHKIAIDFVENHHPIDGVSVVVGGGHDHGFTHLKGVKNALSKVNKKLRLGCINIDAHLDVRAPSPKISSGSPFFLAIESGTLSPSHFVEFGIQTQCNAADLWKYVTKKDIRVVHWDDLRGKKIARIFKKEMKAILRKCDALVVSVDLDAVAEAHAPGVSAPVSEGLSPQDLMEIASIAGNEKKVVSLGIFELNPLHDHSEMTARLAATTAFRFFDAFINRSASR